MFLILVNADASPLAVIQNANIDIHLSDKLCIECAAHSDDDSQAGTPCALASA